MRSWLISFNKYYDFGYSLGLHVTGHVQIAMAICPLLYKAKIQYRLTGKLLTSKHADTAVPVYIY